MIRDWIPQEGRAGAWLRLADETGARRWWVFRAPVEVLIARRLEQVAAVLRAAADAVEAGLEAVGILTYEAAPAFDGCLATHPAGVLPPLWVALFERREAVELPEPRVTPSPLSEWQDSMTEEEHRRAVQRIHRQIAAGNTYQVNLTLRQRARFRGNAFDLFLALQSRQNASQAAFVDLGDHAVCSASPELFFAQRGDRVVVRPMKGTAPRKPSSEADRVQRRALAESPKERAENVMIVDMLRNDLGRIARPGSVQARSLFDIERYSTLWQMTSTVTARTDATPIEVLAAAFPCGSVTGAPKSSTMRLIRELEEEPREIYTGSVFWLGGGRRAEASVAIRTAWVDRCRDLVEYGTGGGIVWDSVAAAEWRECRTKALVLVEPPTFELLETLLWRPGRGYWLLAEHLARLVDSAEYFAIARPADLERRLADLAESLPQRRHRIRMRLSRRGELRLEAALEVVERRRWRTALAARPVDSSDPFLYHKTTHRQAYEAARASRPGVDDVLLWNERGELTESTVANVALHLDGGWVTPSAECGLLCGTLRQRLLERGWLREARIPVERLLAARGMILLNSVRGLVRAELADAEVGASRPEPHLASR